MCAAPFPPPLNHLIVLQQEFLVLTSVQNCLCTRQGTRQGLCPEEHWAVLNESKATCEPDKLGWDPTSDSSCCFPFCFKLMVNSGFPDKWLEHNCLSHHLLSPRSCISRKLEPGFKAKDSDVGFGHPTRVSTASLNVCLLCFKRLMKGMR